MYLISLTKCRLLNHRKHYSELYQVKIMRLFTESWLFSEHISFREKLIMHDKSSSSIKHAREL